MESVKLRYRSHIDGLRGVAVLAVLGFHAFPEVVRGGFIGVDIFFVISGFLISRILYADFEQPDSKGGSVIADFYRRRVRRIFPALIVVLLSCYLLGFFLLLPGEFKKLSLNVVASAGFCLNFLISGQENYFNAASNPNPLLHLWSLGVEEQFYLFWPLVIWLAVRRRIKILPVVVFLAALSFCWNAQKYEDVAAAAFYLPQMRMWELLIGAIAAALLPLASRGEAANPRGAGDAGRTAWNHFLRGGTSANILAVLGVSLIGAGLIVIKRDFSLPNKLTLLPTLGAACLVCSDGSAWINRKILSQRILVWIGLISYPLYLWHWPLLSFVHISSARPNSDRVIVLTLGVSVLLAWLTYRLIELPVRHQPKGSRVVIALVGAMIFAACLGYWGNRARGFPSRFPPLINEISAFDYNPAAAVRQGTYFLLGDQNETNFKQDPGEILPGKPTLYLWGDSHAAALYPGLNEVYGSRYNIVQRTTAITAPFMPEYYNPGNAQRINRYVFQSIVRDRPEIVLLEADWPRYKWKQVEATIAALKAAGIHRVVLVGPVPHWIDSLPQQLFNYVRNHRSEPIPMRLTRGVDPTTADLDKLMADFSEQRHFEYIAPYRILGNQDGVLIRTGDTADSLMTYDESHLTVSGSKYLVAHFPSL